MTTTQASLKELSIADLKALCNVMLDIMPKVKQVGSHSEVTELEKSIDIVRDELAERVNNIKEFNQ